MTAQRCTHSSISGTYVQCRNPAEWVVRAPMTEAERKEHGSVMPSYSCEKHLPDFERADPDAMILPLDTENH